MDAYVFEAELVEFPDVTRRIAVRVDQTFWLDGEFWGSKDTEYTSPFEPELGVQTADVELDSLGLIAGQEIAYVFDAR